jgi:hypothetical protein
LPHCLVSLIDDVQAPSEVAGVLVSIAVGEGDQVTAGAGSLSMNANAPPVGRYLLRLKSSVACFRTADWYSWLSLTKVSLSPLHCT